MIMTCIHHSLDLLNAQQRPYLMTNNGHDVERLYSSGYITALEEDILRTNLGDFDYVSF